MMKSYEILKSVSLFHGINESECEAMLSCLSSRIRHYGRNEAVFRKGEPAEYVGIILNGQAQVIKEDYYGNRSLLTVLNRGMLFGETFACADIKTLPVSVFTTADSDILFIDYRRLTVTCQRTCSFHSRVILNMLQILASKNLMLNQKLEFVTRRTTREKLLAYLSFEAEKSGSSHFTIPYSRQELADYLSVDRSAMSAELGRLRDAGILRFHKNQFDMFDNQNPA